MISLVRPELPTASLGSSQAPTAAVDNSAPSATRPQSTYKSGKAVQTNGATSNTVESSFALLKRGLVGTFHHVGEQHLQRYINEFDFRWNTRTKLGFNDVQRTTAALKGIEGKRLTYRGAP